MNDQANLKWKQLNLVGSLCLITLPSKLPRAHTEMFDVEWRSFRMTEDFASLDLIFFNFIYLCLSMHMCLVCRTFRNVSFSSATWVLWI